MPIDDAHSSHNHGFELPNAPQVVVRNDPRRWRAVAGVALCLGLAGIVTGLIVARRQTLSDEHITSDALQREELRDGWKALGAAAVHEAQNNDAQAVATTTAAPSAAPAPSVVIVNVPAQAAPAAPSNVTNINVPSAPPSANIGTPTANPNMGSGYATTQSLPAISYSPAQGYLPTAAGYAAPAPSSAPSNNYGPQNSYGTTGNPAPLAPAVGNGSIPGSTPNPALPNNGLVGSSPTPGQPNGPATGGGSTPSLPSGFSAP